MRKAAVEAFDKAIAADPTKADSYYWKGSNLIGMATLKDDKMIGSDGTAEAFQKYLEAASDRSACRRSESHARRDRRSG